MMIMTGSRLVDLPHFYFCQAGGASIVQLFPLESARDQALAYDLKEKGAMFS